MPERPLRSAQAASCVTEVGLLYSIGEVPPSGADGRRQVLCADFGRVSEESPPARLAIAPAVPDPTRTRLSARSDSRGR